MSLNYMKNLVEEIALEGLDGITLQALWARLENRKEGKMFMDEPMKEFMWSQVQKLSNVETFLLPKPRADMNLPKFPDPERDVEEMLSEVMQHMKSLYPYCPVEANGVIKGSCSTFSQRKVAPLEIKSISLQECTEKYGSRLVIVADQETRGRSLMGTNPFWREMAVQHYCVLESIGRGRHFGMYSFGPASLQEVMKADPRTMFYIRKKLLVRGVLTKQMHILKSSNTMCRSYLLQLARYHTTIKSNITIKQERVLNVLLMQPERRMVYTDLREAVGMEALPFKKMAASMNTNGVIEFLLNVPYRTMYPESTANEYQKKGGVEKVVRVVILKRDTLEEVKPEGDDDSDDDSKECAGLLDQTNQTLDRTLLYQAYQATEIAGSEGLTQKQLGSMLGLSKLDSRAICRQLIKEGFVSQQMMDSGRQRLAKYTAIRLQRKDYRLALEREKFVSLTGSVEMLEMMLYSNTKTPRNFVLKYLREQAEEVKVAPDENDDVEVSEIDALLADVVDIVEVNEEEAPITYRVLKRANQILSMVMQYKVISDFSLIQKVISEEEAKEGYEYKIDRKSLFRLISKLQKVKSIKLYKAIIKSGNTSKSLTFVCSCDIESDNSLIQSAIAQASFRPNVTGEKREDDLEEEPSSKSSASELQKWRQSSEGDMSVQLPIDKTNRYGYCPRFVRMRLMHQLVFYLTWDYTGKVDMDQETAFNQLGSKYDNKPQDLHKELEPPIYRSAALDYRTFIPPLPEHDNWSQGWILLADIVLRVPLCLFVRLVRVRHVVPGLQEMLDDPIRKNYLLSYLPQQMRNNLLGGSRKFVFALFEAVQKLCFIGLVQFGPQQQKEKDQLFIFVNRRALLLDTTDSPSSYFKIDPSIEYPRRLHFLGNMADQEAYWGDLYQICMNTRLGTREEGSEVIIENVDTKLILLESCAVRLANEASDLDTGHLPGDQLGAGGLDSALFAHLKRNWNCKFLPKEQRLVGMNPLKQKKLNAKKEVARVEARPRPKSKIPYTTRTKSKITRRVVQKRRIRARVKPTYDDFKYRVKWSRDEDFILILCKVATIYLMINNIFPKLPVKTQFLAKLVAKYAPRAMTKNANQCLRRMTFLHNRSDAGQAEIGIYLEEAYQCPKIHDKFFEFNKKLLARKRATAAYEAEVEKGFEELIVILKDKQKQMSSQNVKCDGVILPDTTEEFYEKFRLFTSHHAFESKKKYSAPKSEEEIQFNTVMSLLLSSLTSSADRSKYSLLLLFIFQQYPDFMMRNAISWMRRASLVVTKKKLFAKNKELLAPLSTSPFNFSLSYFYMLQSKIPYEVVQEAYSVLKTMQSETKYTFKSHKVLGGQVAFLFESLACNIVSVSIDASSQIVGVEFDNDIGREEKDQLYKTFQQVDLCQRRLDNFQETATNEESAVPLKRLKLDANSLLFGNNSQFSDDEDDEAAPPPREDRLLSEKEKIIKENVEARLAFYSKREQLQDRRSVNEKRDKRARLMIASCPVICTKLKDFPLIQEEKDDIISRLESEAIISSSCPVLKTVLQSYNALNASEADILNATHLIQIISEGKHLGLTLEVLRSHFKQGEGELGLAAHLGLLTSSGVVLRTGVTTFHYVHCMFQAPWLISSSKSHPDSADQGNENEPIMVAVRPWNKVDSTLNRRALDRYLGSILIGVISWPGCTVAFISDKFTPALTPTQVYELVQMLCCLGCVTATCFSTQPVDLFSDPDIIETVPADFTEPETNISLEPTGDAIIRFTQFVGDKEYTTNFLDEIKSAAQLDNLGKQL